MEPTNQQIIEVRSVCQSGAYKFIVDLLETELKDQIESKMMKAETLSGSLHGEWKTMRRVIERLRGFAKEYDDLWASKVASNPHIIGQWAAGRVPDDDNSLSDE